MQIHELTQPRLDEALGAAGSFLSGLTGGMSDKWMDKTPGGVKPGWVSSGVNPADYGAGYVPPSAEWKDKYKALQTDPTVSAYVKTIAPGWVKNQDIELKKVGSIAQPAATTKPAATPKTKPAPGAKPAATTKPAAGAGAFGQMANQLGTTGPSSTGGKTQATPTGLRHTANPNNPNNPPNNPPPPGGNNPPNRMAAMMRPDGSTQNVVVPNSPPASAKTRAKYPKAPAAGAVAEPPVFLGGKKLDPAKPNDAKVLQAIKQQGKLHEAVAGATTGPSANQIKKAFQDWSDGQFATRVQETGSTVTMDMVRSQFPDLANDLSSALDKIATTQGTTQQAQAIEAYSKLAVAGVQAVAQMQKNKISTVDQQQNKQFATTSGGVKQSLRQAGVDPDKLAQFGAQAKASGNSMTAKRSDNQDLNTLAKLAGFTLI